MPLLQLSQILDQLEPSVSSMVAKNLKNLEEITNEIHNCEDEIKIKHELKPKCFGKDGYITVILSFIKNIDPGLKKEYSMHANAIKQQFEQLFSQKTIEIEHKKMLDQLKSEAVDATIPPKNIKLGSFHVITKTIDDMVKILGKYNFQVFDGPEIDSCENNFTKLNIPENHPARQMHDTFYIKNPDGRQNPDYILRTHTSTIQIRAMMGQKPPIRGISFGKVFRFDSDATHSPMFHQIECFCVEEGINMSHLNFIIQNLLQEFFETNVETRFRPSFFPFTEPSMEVDISYIKTNNSIKIAQSNNFLEIGGAGMIHPQVLENCGIDSSKYRGFALGFGVDRLAMLKYGLSDIRKFYNPSTAWIKSNGIPVFDL